jgi:hypothetical protein
MMYLKRGSVGIAVCEIAHQSVDLASCDCHGNPLDGADLLFGDALCLGHAKVMCNSWLAFSGDSRCQANDSDRAFIEIFLAAHGIVEITVSFVWSRWKHRLSLDVCWLSGIRYSTECSSLCSKIVRKMQENRPPAHCFPKTYRAFLNL